ncbi:MAG: hypothetical protein A4E43_01050 [Methanosaeta sp. PtaB.Bin005]|jgi:hypothetical protein|nr:MAG: hypothetical protein A4E43_01050 [Methanosaeta sp. PtaB.Bin005]
MLFLVITRDSLKDNDKLNSLSNYPNLIKSLGNG